MYMKSMYCGKIYVCGDPCLKTCHELQVNYPSFPSKMMSKLCSPASPPQLFLWQQEGAQ